MSYTKFGFIRFLESAALPMAFSASVLGGVPNERDKESNPREDDEELEQLKLAIANHSDEGHKTDNDNQLFSILRGFLGGDDLHDDHPSEVDHDETEEFDNGDGEELELNPDNIGPFQAQDDVNDMPHSGDTQNNHNDDEKHNQLLAAINDLRDELKAANSGTSQPQSKWKIRRMVDREEEENEESYEEDEQEDTKQASARQLFTSLVNQGKSRQEIIDQFMKQIQVTQSTATSYYQRLAKEAGLTTSGNRELPGKEPPGLGVAAGVNAQGLGAQQEPLQGEPGMEMPSDQPDSNIDGFEVEGDPNKQGLIRTVRGAHLVYKRKNEEGTFDELWVFGTGEDMKNTLAVRRAILAGTDIPPRSTKSLNGNQSYTLTSMGNGQILHITGLPN